MEKLLIAGICLVPFISAIPIQAKTYFRLFINICFAIPTTLWALQAFTGDAFLLTIGQSPITGLWQLKIDSLSAFFVLITNLIVVCSGFYSLDYLKDNKDALALSIKFISANVLHLAMLAVCMIQQLIPFLIVWEIMSIASFMLVIFQFKKEDTIKAGLNYLVQMHVGVIFLIIAVIVLMISTGGNDFASLGNYFNEHPNNFPLFLLFFTGFGFKVGFIPFHTWMPHAYSAAPSHVSALMSGVIKKLGLYGILRVLLYVQNTRMEIGLFILSVSLLTCLYGVINAIMQKDLKKMLAYSSMENMGVIGIGLGMGMVGFGVHDLALAFLGFAGAILHILNHAIFKPALFYGIGSVYQQTGTRNIEQLGGLVKSMPITAALFLCSGIAVCALPPFNGFISEYILYSGLLEGMNATFVTPEVFLMVSMTILSLAGGMAIYAYTRAIGLAFLGIGRSNKVANASEVRLKMLMPQVLLLLIALSIGIFPSFYFRYVCLIVNMFVPNYSHITLWSFADLHELGYAGAGFIGIVSLLFAVRYFVARKKTIVYGPTWGCGYLSYNTRMQYTGSSYADYFAKFAGPILGQKNKFVPIAPNEIFPENKEMKIEIYDRIEKGILMRVLNVLIKTIKSLGVLQTGQTQLYILYAFIFLIILCIVTFFKIIV
jgi:hydrogenase-4 component B